MMLFFVVAFVFLAVQLLTLFSNLIFFPSLEIASEAEGLEERISILIPARNEAKNLPETLPRVLQQGVATEVIVLNDASNDDTASILAGFQLKYAHLKVLEGKALPEAWTGKNWACQQLSEAATGDTLIFTDADVRWEKSSLASLLAFQTQEKAEFVSVWPRQLTLSALETITIPLVDQILLAGLPYLGVKYSHHPAFAAGNGQVMMWRKEAYSKVGGHAAFKQEVLEDVRMGQAAKRAGLKIALAVGAEQISTRMYHSNSDLIEGFSKNIVAASSNKVFLIILALLNTLSHSLSWLFILINPWWLLIGLMSLSLRFFCNLKTKRDPLECVWQPLMVIPLWLIVLRALRQKSISWKGRSYA